MSKKKLKNRIKELEAENMMLRAMALNPVYVYLYTTLPYNPYWQPYRFVPIGPVTCTPEWVVRPDSNTWVSDGEFTVGWGCADDVSITTKYSVMI